MKRNMDLIRKILMVLNEHEHGYAPDELNIEGFSEDEIGYHCLILGEAGLLEVSDSSCFDSESPTADPVRLTWDGHEFIENAKNENVWSQAKEVVGKVGEASFSVWTGVLSNIVLRNLGLNN